MAATLCGKALPKQGWLPLAQSVRHGSKAVTRHRRPMHFLKKKLMAVTEYIPPRRVPPGAYPPPLKATWEESALVRLMKRDLTALFQENKMVAVAQNNSIRHEEMLLLRLRLTKNKISVKIFPNQVMRLFLNESVYCNMAPLFTGPMVLFVSKEPKVNELLKALLATPQMTLLGACIDHTLLSVPGLVGYSKLPDMPVARGQLVSGLTLLSSCTASMLQHHPARLSMLLQQYMKQQSPDGGTEDAPKSEEAT
ncbi:large ribosomal subunit protein uL10m [Aulostomus maculatus]